MSGSLQLAFAIRITSVSPLNNTKSSSLQTLSTRRFDSTPLPITDIATTFSDTGSFPFFPSLTTVPTCFANSYNKEELPSLTIRSTASRTKGSYV